MQRSNPFSRSLTMMAAIASIMANMPASAQQAELAKLMPYKSRGKGKGHAASGKAAKALHVRRSKYMPHQGEREVMRRQRQIAQGLLSPVCSISA